LSAMRFTFVWMWKRVSPLRPQLGGRSPCSASLRGRGVVSPLFRSLPLSAHGLAWINPPAALAHPLDDGTAATLERSFDDMPRSLGADAGSSLFEPLAANAEALYAERLAPLRPSRHPLTMLRFGMHAFRTATGLARARFKAPPARALFIGCAAHSSLALDRLVTAAFALVLGVAGHAIRWPCARGSPTQPLARGSRTAGGRQGRAAACLRPRAANGRVVSSARPRRRRGRSPRAPHRGAGPSHASRPSRGGSERPPRP
jgi:hypothetical protein